MRSDVDVVLRMQQKVLKLQQLCPLIGIAAPQANLLVPILSFSCFLLQWVQLHILSKREQYCCTCKWWRKWDSSKIGGKRDGFKGKQGAPKGYTTARAGTSNTRAAAQDAASSIFNQVVCMPAADQAALLQSLTAALSESVVGDKGGKR
jgi:hypothetical protein